VPATQAQNGSTSPEGDRPHVVVLGGGVCGLYGARKLVDSGLQVTLLERESVVGGLAAGHERAGNYYDLGTHHLHEFDREIFEDVRAIMGDRLIPTPKLSLIRYGRGYRRYPLEFFDLLLGIPPWTLARALVGLIGQQIRNRLRPREALNAEDALIELYGRPLYEFFFRNFTTRYWGMPPSQLSASFVRSKMPRLSAVDIVKKALGRMGIGDPEGAAVDKALAEETLWYARTGSREMPMALAEYVEGHGGRVITGASVEAIELVGDRVVALRYRSEGQIQRMSCDACISTIPLPHLLRAVEPKASDGLLEAASSLRFRPTVVYGLLVRREKVLDALYVYYRDRIFHRIAEPKNSKMVVAPSDHTILLVELMCEPGDDIWRDAPSTRARLQADLEAEGLLRGEEIVEWHVLRAEQAYPVFDLGFEVHHAQLTSFVDGLANLWSTGRQGAFTYPNMHSAMRMGAEAAAAACAFLLEAYPALF
jgi:protoporphyrinogen oxidase